MRRASRLPVSEGLRDQSKSVSNSSRGRGQVRLPYLQVTDETWAKAKMLAGLLGVDRRHAFGLICDLWAWALEMGPRDAPPTGIVQGALARTMLAGAMEWTGDVEVLVDALSAVGLIDVKGLSIRVRGLDRYFETLERQETLRAKWRRANVKRNTAAVTPRLPRGEEGVTAAKDLDLDKRNTAGKKPADPKIHELQLALEADYLEVMGDPYKHGGAKDTQAIKALLPVAATEDIRVTWRWGLKATGYVSCASIAQLSSKWLDLVKAMRPVAAAPQAKPLNPMFFHPDGRKKTLEERYPSGPTQKAQ